MLKDLLKQAVEGKKFTEEEAKMVMDTIMEGKATESQIASLLTILKLRGETAAELTGFAKSMREHVVNVPHNEERLIDTCGTGGDGASTFNISTTVAILLSSLDISVAKHGNRAVSSKSGSADVLEKLDIKIQTSPEEASKALKKQKMSFLFAPLYHTAMKHAVNPRKEIGFRTVFNVLGPLVNPANSPYQLIGVFDANLAEKMAETLKHLGTKRALLVTGGDGLDECTITTYTNVVELNNGEILKYVLSPEEVGLERGNMEDLVVHTVEESASLISAVLHGTAVKSAVNIVLLNAGAALYTIGEAKTIKDGVKIAKEAIENGTAARKLQELQSRGVETHA
ncbi:anthranilate phosphoribosyltransferase [Bacillus taeanensis]|uniref:Anthranilate phosphoribosyltransferase n=1 Tax=Bacillus taeanensis TaxID=273032 RepID=A0A366XXI6_9BACI|nr:anthranilate phosphoribosyltransferase [Bacillus taeanensis]RBW70278.1 anthranilate phosphoribosyltransferase [Bacillus taeanensis]